MTKVAIMRPQDKIEESAQMVRDLGFETICASPVEVSVRDSREFRELLKAMEADGPKIVVFTSATGVKAAFELAEGGGYCGKEGVSRGLRELLGRRTVAAIGSSTAAAARMFGLEVDIIPEEFTSSGIVKTLSKKGVEGAWIAVLRSSTGSQVLAEGLSKTNARVTEIDLYDLVRRSDSPEMKLMIDEALNGRIDIFLFTSALSAKTFMEAGIDASSEERIVEAVNSRTVVAIGKPTRRALEDYGVRVDGVPEKATFEDMMRLLPDLIKRDF